MNVTVAFCCNDERGNFAGRVVEIGIEDMIRLEAPHERGLLMKWTERDRYTNVQIGRRAFATVGKRQVCIGNVFWDAIGMSAKQARALVEYLLGFGWAITEHACEGPFADFAAQEQTR